MSKKSHQQPTPTKKRLGEHVAGVTPASSSLESLENLELNTFEPPFDQPHITANMDIRVLRSSDIPHVQQTNITNLPENYFCKYYMYHAMSWPQLSYVAVDVCRLSQLNCP
jgi:hypothetical protein